ncbi:MAG: hypothetical protein U1E76_21830 [Planctomycetota bacterium]
MIDWNQYEPHRCAGTVVDVAGSSALFQSSAGHQLRLGLLAGEAAPRVGPASVLLHLRATDADMLSPTPEEIALDADHRVVAVTGEVKSFRRNGQEVLLRAILPFIVEFEEYAEWLDSMIEGQVLRVPVTRAFGVSWR